MLEEILSSLSLGNPIALAANLILSTIVGGIVFLAVVGVFAKAFSEEARLGKAFLVILIINIINIPVIYGLIGNFIAAVPFGGYLLLILPLLIWIILVKVFFSGMEMLHVVVIGIVGYALSIIVFPWLTAIVQGYLPVV